MTCKQHPASLIKVLDIHLKQLCFFGYRWSIQQRLTRLRMGMLIEVFAGWVWYGMFCCVLAHFTTCKVHTIFLGQNKKICVVLLTRPTLIFGPRPRTFYWKNIAVLSEKTDVPHIPNQSMVANSVKAVILKIRSKSPKSNKLLILSDLYRLANLVTFHPMVHEIT